MKKITFLFLLAFTMIASAQETLLFEEFDDITTLTDYVFVNVSDAPDGDWFQGNDGVFPSNVGDPTAYIGVNFAATSGSVINTWMLLPPFDLKNGDVLTFFTRTVDASGFPDRLEVRIDPTGDGNDPVDETDVGSYTELLLSINPDLNNGGYPETWELQTVTVSGVTGTVNTRLALRYWVTDAGPSGANSNYIGVDSMELNSVLSTEDNAFQAFNYRLSNDVLTISSGTAFEGIAIYNVLGQEVLNSPLSSSLENIDVRNLNSGVYVAVVTSEGQRKTFKFVK